MDLLYHTQRRMACAAVCSTWCMFYGVKADAAWYLPYRYLDIISFNTQNACTYMQLLAVKDLFGCCLPGSSPARQHHPTPGRRNWTPGIAAWARQLCQSLNQTSQLPLRSERAICHGAPSLMNRWRLLWSGRPWNDEARSTKPMLEFRDKSRNIATSWAKACFIMIIIIIIIIII